MTIAEPAFAEGERVKASRFLARALPTAPEHGLAIAKAALVEARADHPDAAHHAYAFRVAPEPEDFGWSDGGEPIGAAGRPILQRLDQLGLINTVVLVSRIPGGQKLATGDLAKGYGDAARAVLAASQVVPFVPTTRYAIGFDYILSGAVQGVLAAYAAKHEGADYGAEVTLTVSIESAVRAAFEAALRDASAGRAKVARVTA
jgi:putative IMPACT (imprinted ancient) family translation regulator